MNNQKIGERAALLLLALASSGAGQIKQAPSKIDNLIKAPSSTNKAKKHFNADIFSNAKIKKIKQHRPIRLELNLFSSVSCITHITFSVFTFSRKDLKREGLL